MAKPPITQARDVDAELVLQLNKFGSVVFRRRLHRFIGLAVPSA